LAVDVKDYRPTSHPQVTGSLFPNDNFVRHNNGFTEACMKLPHNGCVANIKLACLTDFKGNATVGQLLSCVRLCS
jgi:hypothetical protein